MPWIKLQDGTVCHLNMGRTRKREQCSWCNRFLSDVLCDYRRPGERKTCSRPLCRHCAEHVAPDLDYCPNHNLPPQQNPLFGDAA